jgi:F1F0 ATPase subunit 2
MTNLSVDLQDLISALEWLGWIGLGTAAGLLYFYSLWWNVRLMTARRSALASVVPVARLPLMTAILAIIAVKFGAAALLLAVAGIAIARSIAFGRKAQA